MTEPLYTVEYAGFLSIADIHSWEQAGSMRAKVPASFNLSFTGIEGTYSVHFQPTDDWDGSIEVSISGQVMRWEVVDADRESSGGLVLSGMTSDSEDLWGDQFWFELRLSDDPPVIRYWGNQVLWREDRAA